MIPASIILEGFQAPAFRLRTSDNSISSLLSPVSSRLLSHFLYPYPQYSLALFPFVFPFRLSAFCFSFFRFRHLLCLSYAINLLCDRGNQQPAMSRMVRHDLSREKKFRAILHTEKAKKAPSVPQRSPDVAPPCPNWLDLFLGTIAFSAVSALSACCCLSSSPDYFPLYIRTIIRTAL